MTSFKNLQFFGPQKIANCALFAIRNLVQSNKLSAKKFQEFADSFVEGIRKHGLQIYFMETQYELDEDGNAIMYDALVVKAQLAFFGIALRDHDFKGHAFASYAEVVRAPPPQGTEGRRFLFLLQTKDDPPAPHFAVLMCVARKGAKPYRWLCSLRVRADAYDTYEDFIKVEAPRYGKIEKVFEMVSYYFPLYVFTTCLGVFGGLPMRFPLLRLSFTQVAGEKYESIDSYLQAIQVAVHNS